MSSYAANRDALFGSSGGGAKKPGAKPGAKPAAARSAPAARAPAAAKAPLSLGGPSAASLARKREQQAALRAKGDAFLKAGDDLMPEKKTGFAALMAKKPNPLFASSEYAKAANAYAAADAKPEAVAAYEKAAACHAATDAHHTAAQELEKAAPLAAGDAARLDLVLRAAAAWGDAGEACRAAETAVRAATKRLVADPGPAVKAAMDYADAGVGSTAAPDVYRSALCYYAGRGAYADALAVCPRLLKALDAARMDADPSLHRCLAATVVLLLALRDVDGADAAFLEALGRAGFASSSQAEAAEDLLVAYKPGADEEAFEKALASRALQTLDHEVAQCAKQLPRPDPPAPVVPVPRPPPEVRLEDLPPPPGDDDSDDLPDLT